MDLDIEMDVDDVQEVHTIPEAYTHDIITGEEHEPGEVDEPTDTRDEEERERAIVPYKVHIRGLDTFNPNDVKAYLAQHYDLSLFDRTEWIDDNSANLIFKSEATAQEALIALADVPIADVTQLPPLESVRAKDFAAKPDSVLQVRFAVASDRKAPGAAQRSRFYLLHPDFDPEERRRRGDYVVRGKYRDRDDGYSRRGDRRRRGGSRQDEDEPETFDVSLYDDDAPALAQRAQAMLGRRPRSRRRDSIVSSSSESDKNRSQLRRNKEKELFPDWLSSRNGGLNSSRNRSASPVRDRDGDARMDVDDDARLSSELRNRERDRAAKERLLKENRTRELFPAKDNSVKELFPTKVSKSSGKAQMDQVDDTTVLSSAKLADRITPWPSASTAGSSAFNIRGLANKRGADQGFAIKGTGATVKELFPDRFLSGATGNAGKELFAEKLEGRGRRRQKAEDSFY
ncbi:hypothetical protein B0H63DRAFT_244382 [Podospora didyma]|uniref:Uncharacterized protein n=1 Tax=Podospora didyma TaxID=330526 RepID=A0AAE0KL93_9PEZI|nr:hypothetical protein B0H63DRAFT_244382 [Podospora didyma]